MRLLRVPSPQEGMGGIQQPSPLPKSALFLAGWGVPKSDTFFLRLVQSASWITPLGGVAVDPLLVLVLSCSLLGRIGASLSFTHCQVVHSERWMVVAKGLVHQKDAAD